MQVRLIDANAVGYAQQHAQPVRLHEGRQTQALYGTLLHIRKLLDAAPSTVNVVLWDGRAQWRYELHPGYKSQRHLKPEQRVAREHYESQRAAILLGLACFPVIQVQHPGAEADDLAYGLSKALARQGHLVTLYTADHDWLQCVDQRVRLVSLRKPQPVVELDGFSRTTEYAHPRFVAPIKALTGDESDSIEGLDQVGPKRAAALLSRYGTLERALAAAGDFLAFSSEHPGYFHPLTTEEVRSRVRRNLQLVDLSKAPGLSGTDIEVVVGRFDQLDLWELFYDHGLTENLEYYGAWERRLSKDLAKSDVLSVERAVKAIASAWSHGRTGSDT